MTFEVGAARLVANIRGRGIRICTDGYTLAIEPADRLIKNEVMALRVLRPLVIAVLRRLPVDERGAWLVMQLAIQRAADESSWAKKPPVIALEGTK